jgi:hypothetical protein
VLSEYLASLPAAADEVDLSSFEHIEELDNETWHKLNGRRSSMKRLKLPSALIEIREEAFDDCDQLTRVTLPSSLRSIENYAFGGCTGLAMRDLKLPASMEYLGKYAFHECRGLTGKLTTHITGSDSFAHCSGLTALDLTNC